MKRFSFLTLFFVAFLAVGCAHSPAKTSSAPPSTLANSSVAEPKTAAPANDSVAKPAEVSAQTVDKSKDDDKYLDDEKYGADEEVVTIADPLEPFNRAMFVFNDKLYFWMLKPVAQGYSKVVPEPARISVKNFFTNLGFPIRFVSCVLQADFSGAATEFGRFGINTVWGIGGLMDPAADKEIDLQKQDTDLGQTLGVYGVGQGFYFVWPILGPSTPRDSIDIVGEYFLYPVSYIYPWYSSIGVRAYEIINSTSLRIGDYESLKDAAIDHYVAVRDAYVQYRQKKVKARKAKLSPAEPQADDSKVTEPGPSAK